MTTEPTPHHAAGQLRLIAETTFPADLKETVALYLDGYFGHQEPDDRAETLWLIASNLDLLKRTLEGLQKVITDLRIRDILEHGHIRLGDHAYKVSPNRTRKLLVSVETFVDYLRENDFPLEEIFSLSERVVRITAFRNQVEARLRQTLGQGSGNGELDDEVVATAVQTIEDTFFEYANAVGGGDRLDELPLDEAKWAKALGHRQRRPGRKSVTPGD